MNQKIHQSDLGQVFELLFPARTKWYSLGLALEVNSDTLDSIEENNPVDICLRKMLKTVLHTKTSLTWSDLCEALRTPTVGRNDVAKDTEVTISTKRKGSLGYGDGNSGETYKGNLHLIIIRLNT